MKQLIFTLAAASLAISAYATGEITVLPEGGNTVIYERSSRSYYPYQGYPLADDDKANAAQVTFYENGDVYIFRPFASFDADVYIKGHINEDGTKAIFPLPQPIGTLSDGYDYLDLYATRMVYREEYASLKPADDQNLVFDIFADGSIIMEGYKPTEMKDVVMLGLSDKFNIWRYYGEQSLEFQPITDGRAPIAIPDGAAVEQWSLINAVDGHDVNVAFAGSDVFIQGFFQGMPEATIWGTIDGNEVIFPDGQYLGIYSNHFIYALSVLEEEVYDEEWEMYIKNWDWLDETIMDLSDDRKSMKARNSILVNAGNTSLLEVYTITEPLIRSKESQTDITNPQRPEFVGYTPYSERYDGTGAYGTFAFKIPLIDNNYNLLDKDKLFYQIFFNNETEPYTFDKSEYQGLDENMTDIPFGFNDKPFGTYGNLHNFACIDENEHYVYFWRSDATRVGVRSVYYYNGETYYSDTMYVGSAGVESTELDAMPIATEYYDLCGRKVENPQGGIFIRSDKYANGKVTNSKEIIR